MQNNNGEKHASESDKRNVKADLTMQQGPENGSDSIFSDANLGSFNAINLNNEQNQKTDLDTKDNLMPNPDDFDEGDDEDSEGKGKTLGL